MFIRVHSWQKSVCFISSPEHEPQRYTVKSESLAELVDKVALVGIMNVIGLVGENYEAWRPGGNLCGKVEFDPSPVR